MVIHEMRPNRRQYARKQEISQALEPSVGRMCFHVHRWTPGTSGQNVSNMQWDAMDDTRRKWTTNWARCRPFLIRSLGKNLDINVAYEDVRPLLVEAQEVKWMNCTTNEWSFSLLSLRDLSSCVARSTNRAVTWDLDPNFVMAALILFFETQRDVRNKVVLGTHTSPTASWPPQWGGNGKFVLAKASSRTLSYVLRSAAHTVQAIHTLKKECTTNRIQTIRSTTT